MLRKILCVAVVLCVCAAVAVAKDKEKGKGKGKGGKKVPVAGHVVGTVKSVDADAGTITVTFKVGDATAVVVTNADGTTKELTGKDGLKESVVKEGASIKVTSNASGAATGIAVGGDYSKPDSSAADSGKPHKKKGK